MAGNVWEWTSSLYQDYPYDAQDGREDVNSTGPSAAGRRVGQRQYQRPVCPPQLVPPNVHRHQHRFSLCPLTIVLKNWFLSF